MLYVLNLLLFQNRAKSPEMVEILQKALKPLDAFMKGITVNEGNVINEEIQNFLTNTTYSDLQEAFNNMMNVIYERVNLPCKEQAQLLVTQVLYQCYASKLIELHNF